MQAYDRNSRGLSPPVSMPATSAPPSPKTTRSGPPVNFLQHRRRASSARRRAPPARFYNEGNPLFGPDEFSGAQHNIATTKTADASEITGSSRQSGPLRQNGPHPDWKLTLDEEEHTRLTGRLPAANMNPVLLKLRLKSLKLCALGVEGVGGVAGGVVGMGEKVRRHVTW